MEVDHRSEADAEPLAGSGGRHRELRGDHAQRRISELGHLSSPERPRAQAGGSVGGENGVRP